MCHILALESVAGTQRGCPAPCYCNPGQFTVLVMTREHAQLTLCLGGCAVVLICGSECFERSPSRAEVLFRLL